MSRLVIHKSTDNITIKTKNYTNVLFYYTKMSEQKNTTFYSVSLPTLKHLYRKKECSYSTILRKLTAKYLNSENTRDR